jgi:hypothetical protein
MRRSLVRSQAEPDRAHESERLIENVFPESRGKIAGRRFKASAVRSAERRGDRPCNSTFKSPQTAPEEKNK